MTTKTHDVLLRSDRVLVVALAVILCAASAAVGASLNHPGTEQAATVAAVPAVAAAIQPAVVPAPAPKVVPAAVQAIAVEPAVVQQPANDLAMTQLLAEHRCLSEVMYYEARGESQDGQMAIAEVVFHRLRHGHYGHSICAVVYEGQGTGTCQFSFACDGARAVRKSAGAWRHAETLAARILTGEVALRDVTGDATHFHAISVSPDWADDMERTVQIGNHVFYRRARSHSL
ncbi:MAG TPA: cell wall hydrolase [Rhizomicrobium sp.]|nr:cell wall hydrolase [Rhizomicrobium sp.]